VGHENSHQIAIKSLFWPKCRIASYNTQEAKCQKKIKRENSKMLDLRAVITKTLIFGSNFLFELITVVYTVKLNREKFE
jgi:hypothetical protein